MSTLSWRTWLALYVGSCAATFFLYAGALDGQFLSDDINHVPNNPHIQRLDGPHLLALLDPSGQPARATSNYAPVHLLIHALQFQAFGLSTRGYHVSNVLLHAGVCLLLAAFYLSSGVPRAGALLLAALFLVHPANVESVAWIFQVKSIVALGLSVAALLAFPRRPLASGALFALALLAKISALYALPVAAARLFVRRAPRRDWAWLGLWLAVAAACSAAEFPLFQRTGQAPSSYLIPDPLERARSMVAIAGRYLAMATTSYGVAPTHEPPPAGSWLDPWWLFGAAALGAIGARAVATFRQRSEEAVYWVWAAASYAPVCQVFAFIYPMADRYLYFILPGLLGAGYWMVCDAVHALEPRLRIPSRRLFVGAVCVAAAVGVALAAHTARQAFVWRSEAHMMREAVRWYPDGIGGLFLRARSAALKGDWRGAIAALDRLADRGYAVFVAIDREPAFAPMRESEEYQRVFRRVASNWIRSTPVAPNALPAELRAMGLAHWIVGDYAAAEGFYLRALEAGGPDADLIQSEWEMLRRARR
jgi:protein O-mannosyl-transferase